MRVFFSCIIGVLCCLAPRVIHGDQPPRFELTDGDRVVFLGDALIERDQRYGYLETFLSISNPDKNLIFRNLGWSGDTVGGISRSGFDPPAAGFEQLRQQILAVKPTVVVVGYGMADSFAGEAGLPGFEQGLSRLLNVIDSTKARVVMLSPVAHANLGPPLPDPTGHNGELGRYRDVIQNAARMRKSPFIDLFDFFVDAYSQTAVRQSGAQPLLTDNGINLTAAGYWAAASTIGSGMAQIRAFGPHQIKLERDGTISTQEGTTASGVESTPRGLRWAMIDDFLPLPIPPGSNLPKGTWPSHAVHSPRTVQVTGLSQGRHELKIDGSTVATADSAGWHDGIVLGRGPELEQVEALRAAINRKNDLFFYRWRPQNNTYLLGFRKHEQGNNAIEIPQFDPLVAEQEKLIARLKKPVSHIYELLRVEKEVGR